MGLAAVCWLEALSRSWPQWRRRRPTAVPTSDPGPTKSVLLVHAEDPYLPWVSDVTAGIYAALEKAPSGPPGCLRRAPRSGALPEPAHAARAAAWLLEKYRGGESTPILAVSRAALDFVLARSRASSGRGCRSCSSRTSGFLEGTPLPPDVSPSWPVSRSARLSIWRTALLPGNPPHRVRQRRIGHRAGGERKLPARLPGPRRRARAHRPVGPSDGRARRRGSLPCRRTRSSSIGAIRVDGAGRSFVPRERSGPDCSTLEPSDLRRAARR